MIALLNPLMLAEDAPWGRTIIWSGVLLITVCVGVVIIAFARRSIAPREGDETPDGFTLHGLRQLHAQGLITGEEFARAKAALIERVKSRPAADAEDPSLNLLRDLHARRGKAGNDGANPQEPRDESPDRR